MPLELLTMVGGFLLTAVVKLFVMKMRQTQAKHEMLMDKLKTEARRVNQARKHNDKGFKFTRRIIALASIASIVVIPILAGWISPDLAITHGWESTKGGFLFFTEAKDVVKWGTGTGIILAPFHSHLVAAISGMYFGSSAVDD